MYVYLYAYYTCISYTLPHMHNAVHMCMYIAIIQYNSLPCCENIHN